MNDSTSETVRHEKMLNRIRRFITQTSRHLDAGQIDRKVQNFTWGEAAADTFWKICAEAKTSWDATQFELALEILETAQENGVDTMYETGIKAAQYPDEAAMLVDHYFWRSIDGIADDPQGYFPGEFYFDELTGSEIAAVAELFYGLRP